MCECEESLVLRLEQDFKSTLQEQNSLEQWATWLESSMRYVIPVSSILSKFEKAIDSGQSGETSSWA